MEYRLWVCVDALPDGSACKGSAIRSYDELAEDGEPYYPNCGAVLHRTDGECNRRFKEIAMARAVEL